VILSDFEAASEQKKEFFLNTFSKDLYEEHEGLFENPLSSKVLVNFAEYLMKEKNVSISVA
jgi:hypothetical protein